MIYLFHGENHIQSRSKFNDLIEQYKQKGTTDIARLNGEKVDVTDFQQALESKSLFAQNKLIIIENIFSRKTSTIKNKLIKYLFTQEISSDLIIWEKKQLTPAKLKNISKKARVLLFKVSPKIFKFLDSVAPKNQKQMLTNYHECLKSDAAEFIFYMLSRRVSQLIIANDLGGEGLTRLAPWQKSRLVSQSKRFDLNKLTSLHHILYQTDYNVKTGKNVLPLASTLDLVLADI